MIGLINKAAKALIIQNGGETAWEKVKASAGVTEQHFVALETYDDDITYRLVGSASEHLGLPVEDVLSAFGRHWILYTADEGYGGMMEMWGDTLPEFLNNLNHMHARIRLSMPELRPPVFEVEGDDTPLTLHYWSEREGLAPMLFGLLKGLGERFGQVVHVEQTKNRSAPEDWDSFLVSWTDQISHP